MNKYLLFDGVFIILSLLVYLFIDMNSFYVGKILIIISIISSIQLIYRYKEFDYLVIFFIFGILYWIYLLAYYFFGIPYHYILTYQNVEYTNIIVLLQTILLRVIFLGINPKNIKIMREYLRPRKNNLIFSSFIFIIILLIPIILITTPIHLSETYDYHAKSSILFEYVLIFIIVASVYANTKIKQRIIIGLSSIYLILPLFYHKRLPSIMVGLVLFNLFFSGKMKIKYILIFTILGFIGFRLFAALRVNMEEIHLLNLLLGINSENIMSNNQGGVVVCSVTYYGLIENGSFDFLFRLKSLIGTFASTVLPSSSNLEETFVNLYTMKYYANIPGNGGLSSIYLYIWGGLFGVIIGGLIFNYFLRNPKNSRLVFVYLIFMFATFPRWYAYNMFILIKMGFWLMVFLAIADTYHKYGTRRIIK